MKIVANGLTKLIRIVIPIELRRTMGIATKDSIEIFVEGDQIILKKYQPCCIFCGDASDVVTYRDKLVCKHCLEEIGKL